MFDIELLSLIALICHIARSIGYPGQIATSLFLEKMDNLCSERKNMQAYNRKTNSLSYYTNQTTIPSQFKQCQ